MSALLFPPAFGLLVVGFGLATGSLVDYARARADERDERRADFFFFAQVSMAMLILGGACLVLALV